MIYGMGEVLANTHAMSPMPSKQLPAFLRPPVHKHSQIPYHRDFLMLTEFTEDVGPVPLVSLIRYKLFHVNNNLTQRK